MGMALTDKTSWMSRDTVHISTLVAAGLYHKFSLQAALFVSYCMDNRWRNAFWGWQGISLQVDIYEDLYYSRKSVISSKYIMQCGVKYIHSAVEMKFPLSSYLSQFTYYVFLLIYIYILEHCGDSNRLHHIKTMLSKGQNHSKYTAILIV